MTKLLQTRIAFLESQVDLLETELTVLNDLLTRCGFAEGIRTLKTTVQEILSTSSELSRDDQELG
ncbi:MAG: hypothetical protein KBA81_04675 [Rhabdochlamydiaceae bacterium]|nr:hypothetical protein [Rhabdochlamydiaceae bacterium]